MKQISIYPVIVKSKALSDGSHRLRIAVSHNNATRYILTRFVIPSDKNFRNGEVAGIPTASSINRKLRELVSHYYDIYDNITNAEVLTCSQVVSILKDGISVKPTTLDEIAKDWILSKENSVKEATIHLYEAGVRYAEDFFGNDYLLSQLSPLAVIKYQSFLKKEKKLNTTTLSMKMNVLRMLVRYGITHGHLSYTIDPFLDYKVAPKVVRRVALTVEQLRRLRDADLKKNNAVARDYFMFSFYTCGMNIVDVQNLDISKDVIRFRRIKTENRRSSDEWTEFTMQPEARAIADKSISKERLKLSKANYVTRMFDRNMPKIREKVLPEVPRLIYYSARKTFAQIAAELNVPDSVIEYCIGDRESSKTISFYRHTTREMADREIRKVFDFVASGMTTDEWMEMYYRKIELDK